MQSASLLLRAAGKRSGACIPRLAASQITSSAAASTGRQTSTSHAGCVTQHGPPQLRAVLTSCTASSAACSVVRSQSTAAAAAIGLQAAGAPAAAAAARSAPTGSWIAGAAVHIGAAVRPASETLKRELRAVFQPAHVVQRAQRACRTGSNAAGGAPLGSALLHGTNTAALPAAGPQSAAAAKHLVRLPQPRPASSSSSAAAAGHACRQQPRGGVTSSRVRSPAAGLAQRQGPKAAGTAAHQQARAYNGYSRASYQSPYASVSLSRGMNPMHALYGVIGLNVAVFLLWQLNPQVAARNFLVSPQHIRDGRVYTLLTSAFSHAELSHLAVNMITLYFFGQEIALLFGPKLFLGLYCTAGIAASLSHVAWFWYKAVREGGPPYIKDARLRRSPPALGASGAVSAIVIADVLLNPWRMVLVFPIPIPMPAAILGVFWVASDISGSIRGTGTVGHVAHLGGAATGAAFYWAWRRGLLRRRW